MPYLINVNVSIFHLCMKAPRDTEHERRRRQEMHREALLVILARQCFSRRRSVSGTWNLECIIPTLLPNSDSLGREVMLEKNSHALATISFSGIGVSEVVSFREAESKVENACRS